jgi:hypothetical protein
MRVSSRAFAVLCAAAALAACRNGVSNASGKVSVVPSPLSASGCTGPDQTFTPPQTASQVALSVLAIGPTSQVCAAGNAELLYATGDLATVVAIDVGGAVPVETQLVGPTTIQTLLTSLGIGAAPELYGICVLDASSLLVVEHASNTILKVDRALADTVELWAGDPIATPGFSDGPALLPTQDCPLGSARFAFTTPTALCPTGSSGSIVYVADPGNHALRVVSGGCVVTIAGTGSPFFFDGSLQAVGFDTPVGLSATCSGTLLVAESGAAGAGGNRVRQLSLGQPNFFGLTGTVTTKAGDGTSATVQGDGPAAQLAAPVSLLATSEQDVYWIDSATGILRRMRGKQDTVDCPLWPDCASALADFTPGAVLSLTQTPGGVLYVLDAGAQKLYRVTP